MYVLDTNSIIVFGNYFTDRFTSFWEKLDLCVSEKKIISCREVYNELQQYGSKTHLTEWIESNKNIFLIPTTEETQFITDIFSVPHFQQLVSVKKRLSGKPAADPFVIASEKINGCCVITEEILKPNGAKIPNVCEHFGVDYTDLEGLMQKENWKF